MNKVNILFTFGKAQKIIFSEKFICNLENGIKIYNKSNGALIGYFAEIKNPNHAVITKENILIAKNTMGDYYIYNLENFSLIKKIKIKNFNQPQDSNFILSDNGEYIISCVYAFPNYKLMTYSLKNEKLSLIECPPIRSLCFFRHNNSYYFTGVSPSKNDYGVDAFLCILSNDISNLKIINTKYIGTFDSFNRVVIYKDIIIANIFRENLIYKINGDYIKTATYLSECNPIHSLDVSQSGKYFVISQLSEVLIFGTENLKIIKKIKTNYAYCAKFLESDNILLIGTNQKSYCIDWRT